MDSLSGYFDCNATAPLLPASRERLLSSLNDGGWMNPSGLYQGAAASQKRLSRARERIAAVLGVDPSRVVFTSGATEANNAVIRGFAGYPSGTVLVSSLEHASVLEPARHFLGERLKVIPATPEGTACLDFIEKALRAGDVRAISLMAANNETGVIQPWLPLLELRKRIPFQLHIDAVQWLGKQPLDCLFEADWVVACGHKLGAPRNTGLLIIPENRPRGFCVQHGGGQEFALRSGTEDVPSIEALMVALETVERVREERQQSWKTGKKAFLDALLRGGLAGVLPIGNPDNCLPQTLLLLMPHHAGRRWLLRLDRKGFQVSTGSSCSSSRKGSSSVLQAMGLKADALDRVVRVSGGWATAAEDWEKLAAAFIQVWHELEDEKRQLSSGVIDLSGIA